MKVVVTKINIYFISDMQLLRKELLCEEKKIISPQSSSILIQFLRRNITTEIIKGNIHLINLQIHQLN